MNRAIQNGWFFLTFMGSLLFIVAALLLNLRGERRAVLVITFAANIVRAVVSTAAFGSLVRGLVRLGRQRTG